MIRWLLEVDPLTPLTRCMPGWADLSEGNLPEAIAPYREMHLMDPANPVARLFYTWVLALNGRRDEVVSVVDGFGAADGATTAAKLARVLRLAVEGRSREVATSVTAKLEETARSTDFFARLLANVYALIGDEDRALRWLQVAIDRGFINYPYLAEYDPLLKGLRKDKRFIQLLARVRERWERFEE